MESKSVTIRENLEAVRERIAAACSEAGSDPESVRLVGISKTVDLERVNEAVTAGLGRVGENRVQEAAQKFPRLTGSVEKHMVGHLQTNKVKRAIELFDWIQSIDSERLALEVQRRAEAAGKIVCCLIEVNTSGEDSKFGVSPEGAAVLVEALAGHPNLDVRGLMTIGPFSSDERTVRGAFDELHNLFRKIGDSPPSGVRMEVLSMGMSADFRWAIMSGSNMVRIGSAIFGPRSY
jgi:pyridoxal phosphate enzyme (YggS family)